jgi:hypothetical protein
MMRSLLVVLSVAVAWACSWDYPIWIPRSNDADPLYRFIKRGKAGYIDRTGRIVIAPRFGAPGNSGDEFHDGLLEIGVSDGRYVDRSGKVVIDKGFYRGWDFSEGLAAAMRKGEKLWGYIDTSGEFAIPPRFEWSRDDYVWPFHDGVAKVEVKAKFGYIDRSGNFAIRPRFADASDFHEGMAWVVTDGPCAYISDGPCGELDSVGGQANTPSCRFGLIDKTGRVVSEARFDRVRESSEGLAPVKVGNTWGFVDKTGATVIPARFEDAAPFSSGLARIREHERYGYVERSGKVRIPAEYKHADSFSEGYAVVGDGDGLFWYIDRNGNRQFDNSFGAASPFFKGLAQVRFRSDDKSRAGKAFAYIDTEGRRIFAY